MPNETPPVETVPADTTPKNPTPEVKTETSPVQKTDPFADPAVAAEINKLRGQISTLTPQAEEAGNLRKQLAEAQGKITEYETAQLTEAEKKEKEHQDALAAREAAEKAKKATDIENIKLRAFIGSGLKPEFLRFVQGSTEEEVKESIADLQKLIADSAPAPAPVAPPVTTPTVPPITPQPTAPVTQPQAPQKRTFTHAEIASMTPSEYAKNRDAILAAAARNEIK